MDRAVFKDSVPVSTNAYPCVDFAGEKRSNLRSGIRFYRGDRSRGDDVPAFRACLRPHFNDPVRFFQDLRIVID